MTPAVLLDRADLDALAPILAPPRPTAVRWTSKSPTEAQAAVLNRSGVDAAGLSRGQAAGWIEIIVRRAQRNQCSLPQADALRRLGVRDDLIQAATYHGAREVIARRKAMHR